MREIIARERARADRARVRSARLAESVHRHAWWVRVWRERALAAEADARALRETQAELLDLLDHHGPRTREVTLTIRYPA